MSGERPEIDPETRVWVLTDGKAGDVIQARGLAERMGISPELRVIAPRAPFTFAIPWGICDPRESPDRPNSPIALPFPDLLIATGRRTLPYLRVVRARARGKTFAAFLKDPRTGARTADFIWAPAHDAIEGPNVFKTLTSPHRITPEALQSARSTPPPWPIGDGLAVGLLLGGPSKAFAFSGAEEARFLAALRLAASQGVRLLATPSRRTPPGFAQAVRQICRESRGWFWEGDGENPYLALLANAERLIVTADSVNMVGEALATPLPVYVFRPAARLRRIDAFLDSLEGIGAIRPFVGALEPFAREPIDATPAIAAALANAYRRHRQYRSLP